LSGRITNELSSIIPITTRELVVASSCQEGVTAGVCDKHIEPLNRKIPIAANRTIIAPPYLTNRPTPGRTL